MNGPQKLDINKPNPSSTTEDINQALHSRDVSENLFATARHLSAQLCYVLWTEVIVRFAFPQSNLV